MQQVISLVEQLRTMGIEVPPYPVLDGPFGSGDPLYASDSASVQARVESFEAKVVEWRVRVVELHAKHFPPQA
jgi:hypothetical protein